MELNQIKQFRVIAQTESISKAAELLFIAQPSLSQTLKRLEDELGAPLFDRLGRKIVLNDAGKIFLKYCDDIVFALDSAQKEINEYQGSKRSEINILVESTSLLILDIALKLRSNFPCFLPHFYQGFCVDWDMKLFSDRSPDCGIPSKVIMEEPIGVLMPKNHRLASKSRITKKDLSDCYFLSLNPSDALTKIISYYCVKADFKPNITMYVESPQVIQDLLNKDFGIAFSPQYTWHNYYDKELVFKLVEDMPMKHYTHFVMNEKKYITKDIKCFYDAVVELYFEYTRKNSR